MKIVWQVVLNKKAVPSQGLDKISTHPELYLTECKKDACNELWLVQYCVGTRNHYLSILVYHNRHFMATIKTYIKNN